MLFFLQNMQFFKKYYATVFFVAAIFMLLCTILAYAEKKHSDKNTDTPTDKILITSDMLELNRDDNKAEFTGNVKATQGDTVITSDSLTVYYSQAAEDKKTDDMEGKIKKIYVVGNVKIMMDDKTAFAHKAVYTPDDSVLVLSGTDSKIISNNDSVTGDKITFYRDDGRIVIEGGEDKPVKAIFYPEKENR